MVYKWKTNWYKTDAEVAGKVFEELDNTVGLSAHTLVEASRDELAPLHDEFEWNDDVAGELWREQQARTMICNLTVTMETPKNEPVTVRAYMAVDEKMMVDDGIVDDEIVDENISESKDGGFKGVELRRRAVRRYESIKTVLESGEKTNSLMMMAMKELLSFERKYATLEELAGVFREIDKLKTTA